MAKKGEWVRIHNVVLKASDRTARIPDDTRKCDLEMWTKGQLLDETAEIGDVVTIKTATGREEKGTMKSVRTIPTAMESLCPRSLKLITCSEKKCSEVRNNGIGKRLRFCNGKIRGDYEKELGSGL